MPRYLTPDRISILKLIGLYCENEANLFWARKEGIRISPEAKLHLLAFISSQIIPSPDYDEEDTKQHINFQTSDITALEPVLGKLSSAQPGRSVYDELLSDVWEFETDSAEHLFSLFEALRRYMTPKVLDGAGGLPDEQAKISKCSPLGVFVRRCNYEFERLQFADVQKLWQAFSTYRAPSFSQIAADPSNAHLLEIHSPLTQDLAVSLPTTTPISDADISTLLATSITHLQKTGCRLPSSIHSQLHSFFETSADVDAHSLRHFMDFFEAWRSGCLNLALESLHRYFDYSMGRGGGSGGEGGGSGAAGKTYFQYAQLHKSVLFADFECWGESVEALGECICTARENQDPTCLNFALSYLLHLRQVHPAPNSPSFRNLTALLGGSTENEEIAFLKAKAREGKAWSLLSSTLLEEARGEMVGGENVGKAFEHILESQYLNVQHDLRGLMAGATLFESACLERIGQSSLGHRICESVSQFSDSQVPLNDSVRAVCRISHNLAQMGHYNRAKKVLDDIHDQKTGGVLKLETRIGAFKMLAELKRLIHLDKHREATELLAELRAVCNTAGPDVEFETYLLDIQLQLAKQEYEEAMQSLNQRLARFKESRGTDIVHRLHLLTLKAKIFTLSNRSGKGFSIVLRAAATAQRMQMLPVLVMAVGALGRILVDLGEFGAAKDLVEAVMGHAFGMPDLQLRAELFECLADAEAGVALKRDASREEAVEHMSMAVGYIDRSLSLYAQLEDLQGTLQCLSKKERAAKWCGEDAAAMQAGSMYEQILRTGQPTAVFPKVDNEVGMVYI